MSRKILMVVLGIVGVLVRARCIVVWERERLVV